MATGSPARRDDQGGRRARRSRARLLAVQALYQMDVAQTDVSDVIAEFNTPLNDEADRPSNPAEEEKAGDGKAGDSVPVDHALFSDIVRGVVARQREIDPRIDTHLAAGWRLARVDTTLRATLRAGAFELLARTDIPARVVINEYVDVAKAFFDGDEPRVVNGVLDRLAHELRAGEFSSDAGPVDSADSPEPTGSPGPLGAD